MSGLTLQRVGHVYAAGTPWEHRALSGVELRVAGGEAVAVVGHNGSGKSTLFAIATGLLTPTEGRALLDGWPVADRPDLVAGCLQAARLQLFGATVLDDLRLDPAVDAAEAEAALEAVGLDPVAYAERDVDTLSGGEQRLVALAGALARHPRLLVLDEPFAGLDTPRAAALVEALESVRGQGTAVLVLTPDPDEGAAVGRVVTLRAGSVAEPCR